MAFLPTENTNHLTVPVKIIDADQKSLLFLLMVVPT